MPVHVIEAGDSLAHLAEIHGVFAEDIWNDGRNAALRARRLRYDALAPGDRVFIPDRVAGAARVSTGQRHRFLRKGIPARIRLQMQALGRPRAHVPYRIVAAGNVVEGTTDADGVIDAFIDPSARTGTLQMGDADGVDYVLQFAGMEPERSAGGARKRLANEGIVAPPHDDLGSPEWGHAIHRFQVRHGLAPTLSLDDATWDALLALHDEAGTGHGTSR